MQDFACIYGTPAEFLIYPKDGIWSFSRLYDILTDCENVPCLKGAYPLSISEGGLAWPGTIESTKRWYHNTRTTNTDPNVLVERQIRTCGIKSKWVAIEWRDNWKQLMPASPYFNENVFDSTRGYYVKDNAKLSAICLRAKCNPSMEMVTELCKLFQRRGHTVLETEGFKLNAGQVDLTPKKEHKYISASEVRTLAK